MKRTVAANYNLQVFAICQSSPEAPSQSSIGEGKREVEGVVEKEEGGGSVPALSIHPSIHPAAASLRSSSAPHSRWLHLQAGRFWRYFSHFAHRDADWQVKVTFLVNNRVKRKKTKQNSKTLSRCTVRADAFKVVVILSLLGGWLFCVRHSGWKKLSTTNMTRWFQ